MSNEMFENNSTRSNDLMHSWCPCSPPSPRDASSYPMKSGHRSKLMGVLAPGTGGGKEATARFE